MTINIERLFEIGHSARKLELFGLSNLIFILILELLLETKELKIIWQHKESWYIDETFIDTDTYYLDLILIPYNAKTLLIPAPILKPSILNTLFLNCELQTVAEGNCTVEEEVSCKFEEHFLWNEFFKETEKLNFTHKQRVDLGKKYFSSEDKITDTNEEWNNYFEKCDSIYGTTWVFNSYPDWVKSEIIQDRLEAHEEAELHNLSYWERVEEKLLLEITRDMHISR